MTEPRLACLPTGADLLTADTLGDLSIAIAFFIIPLALMAVRQSKTMPAGWPDRRAKLPAWLVFLFIVFVVLCGISHIMNIVLLWYPFYATNAVIKGFLAVVSLILAAILTVPKVWRLIQGVIVRHMK